VRRADLLAHIELFASLAESDRDALAERLQERSFEAGATIFLKGDAGTSMFIVLQGGVQIALPADVAEAPALVLARLHAGEYFGELALFDDKPRSASATAAIDTKLLELTRAQLRGHFAKSPDAAMTILQGMATRMRETNALLSERAAKDADKEVEEHLSWADHFADRVATWNGSWAFISVLAALTIAWAVINCAEGRDPVTREWRGFDPYPFPFFSLFLAVLAALQGPIIVMRQNRQSDKDRARSENDFRVNLKNEVGIERLQAEVGAHRKDVEQRLAAIERQLRALDGTPRA
jgi:uncharacterized membrane protein